MCVAILVLVFVCVQLASLQHSLSQAQAWEAKAGRVVLATQHRLGTGDGSL